MSIHEQSIKIEKFKKNILQWGFCDVQSYFCFILFILIIEEQRLPWFGTNYFFSQSLNWCLKKHSLKIPTNDFIHWSKNPYSSLKNNRWN